MGNEEIADKIIQQHTNLDNVIVDDEIPELLDSIKQALDAKDKEIAELKAQVEKMKEALEPFAKEALSYDSREPEIRIGMNLTNLDLHKAKEALKEIEDLAKDT